MKVSRHRKCPVRVNWSIDGAMWRYAPALLFDIQQRRWSLPINRIDNHVRYLNYAICNTKHDEGDKSLATLRPAVGQTFVGRFNAALRPWLVAYLVVQAISFIHALLVPGMHVSLTNWLAWLAFAVFALIFAVVTWQAITEQEARRR